MCITDILGWLDLFKPNAKIRKLIQIYCTYARARAYPHYALSVFDGNKKSYIRKNLT